MSESKTNDESSITSRIRALQNSSESEAVTQDLPPPRRVMTRSSETTVTVGHGKRRDPSFAGPAGRASRDGNEGIRRDHTPPVGNHASHFVCPGGLVDEKAIYIRPGSSANDLERIRTIHPGHSHRGPPKGSHTSRRHRSLENFASGSSQSEFREVRSRLRSVREASGSGEDYYEKFQDQTHRNGFAMGDLEQMIDDALEQQSALRKGEGLTKTSSGHMTTHSGAHHTQSKMFHSDDRTFMSRLESRNTSPERSAGREDHHHQTLQSEAAADRIKPTERRRGSTLLRSPESRPLNDETAPGISTPIEGRNVHSTAPRLKATSHSVRQRAAALDKNAMASQSTLRNHERQRRNSENSDVQPQIEESSKHTIGTRKAPRNGKVPRASKLPSPQHDSTFKDRPENERLEIEEKTAPLLPEQHRRKDLQVTSVQEAFEDSRQALGSPSHDSALGNLDADVLGVKQPKGGPISPSRPQKQQAMPRQTYGDWTVRDKSPSTPPTEIGEDVHAAEKHGVEDNPKQSESALERDTAFDDITHTDRKVVASAGRDAEHGMSIKDNESAQFRTLTEASARDAEAHGGPRGRDRQHVRQQAEVYERTKSDSEHVKEEATTTVIPSLSRERSLSIERSLIDEGQERMAEHGRTLSGDYFSTEAGHFSASPEADSTRKATEKHDSERAKETTTRSSRARDPARLSKVQQRARQLDQASSAPTASQSRTHDRRQSRVTDREHMTTHDLIPITVTAGRREEHGELLVSPSLPAPPTPAFSHVAARSSGHDEEGQLTQSVKDDANNNNNNNNNTSLQVNLSATSSSPPSTPPHQQATPRAKESLSRLPSAPTTPIRGRGCGHTYGHGHGERTGSIDSPVIIGPALGLAAVNRGQGQSESESEGERTGRMELKSWRAEKERERDHLSNRSRSASTAERRWDGVSVIVEVRTSPDRAAVGAGAGASASARRFEHCREESNTRASNSAGERIITVNACVTPGREKEKQKQKQRKMESEKERGGDH